MEHTMSMSGWNPNLMRGLKLIFMLFLSVHWLTCLVFGVAGIDADTPEVCNTAWKKFISIPQILVVIIITRLTLNPKPFAALFQLVETWLNVQMDGETNELKYSVSFYFTFTTMLGEHAMPQTTGQAMCSIFVAVVGLGVCVTGTLIVSMCTLNPNYLYIWVCRLTGFFVSVFVLQFAGRLGYWVTLWR